MSIGGKNFEIAVDKAEDIPKARMEAVSVWDSGS